MTHLDKEAIKKDVVRCLAGAEEIKRIAVFGSFLTADDPNDIDEPPAWLSYADENLDVAELSLANNHLNACLHNTQQAVDEVFKSALSQGSILQIEPKD